MRPAVAYYDDARAFAPELLGYAARAREALDVVAFDLAGFRIELATDSDGYVELCRRALVDSDLYANRARTTLRVAVLDYARHPDMPRLPLPTGSEPPLQLGDVLGQADRDGVYDTPYQSWQFFDRPELEGVETLQFAGHFAPWIASFPLRNFLHWGYQAIGWRMVHAGALGTAGKGVMLAGASGAGKSGTTLAGILAGLDSVGDDYVALDLADGRVTAYPVTTLMKQDLVGLRRLSIEPSTTGATEPNWAGKYEFDFERLGGGKRAASFELTAILIPRIAHGLRTTITPAPPHAAMMTFAPSNLLQLPGGWREGMAFSANVVRRLPAHFLDLSDNPAEIAGSIAEFVARG